MTNLLLLGKNSSGGQTAWEFKNIADANLWKRVKDRDDCIIGNT